MAESDVDKLVHETFFASAKTGTIVEVGAAGPTYLSISALYRRLGWRVVAIEPNPVFCDAHRALGYEILEFACADYDRDGVEFRLVDSHGASYAGGKVSFESFSALKIDDGYKRMFPSVLDVQTIHVNVRKLDTLLAEHAGDLRAIDILSVDVEGGELAVLSGLDFVRYRPKVMIIENLLDAQHYRDFMSARGYRLWRKVPPNEIYCMEGT